MSTDATHNVPRTLSYTVDQSVNLHYAVTFSMLHRVIIFEEKYRNWPTFGAS